MSALIEFCDKIFHEMTLANVMIMEKKDLLSARSENAFRNASNAWLRIRGELKHYIFSSLEEEIHFFKKIKPGFTCETEYFSLLNYLISFCPSSEKPIDQKNFLLRETRRLEKFIDRNGSFYIYYTSGATDQDAFFYTRVSADEPDFSFDKTSSGYDLILGQFLCLQRYREYCPRELQQFDKIGRL